MADGAPTVAVSFVRGADANVNIKTVQKRARSDVTDYGIVVVTSGPHKGRIGEFDDDQGTKGIVYFGSLFFAPSCHLIPIRFLSPVTTDDLMRRLDELFGLIGLKAREKPTPEQHIELLTELALVQDTLADRLFVARFSRARTGRRVFISHSSKDKQFARWLAIDLASAGHRPWLDEWQIRAGESIPTRVSEGISDCDFVVVVLSEHAIQSRWVEREWQAKYWDEVSAGRVQVIPALLRQCEIPTLLKTKKYADFTEEHKSGLEDLLFSMAE